MIEINITNFIVEPKNVFDEKLSLVGDEARHLCKVLRAKVGDSFYAIDGTGLRYRAVIESISASKVSGIISSTTRKENEPAINLTLAQGICRPAKMDLIVEKGTELGLSSFIFYFSEKSYKKGTANTGQSIKISRLERLARASAKQSLRSIVPSITMAADFISLAKLSKEYDYSLMAYPGAESKLLLNYKEKLSEGKKVLLLVGPESGLSLDEIEMALAKGFLPIRLGPRRLRTETAGIIFPALLLNLLGEI